MSDVCDDCGIVFNNTHALQKQFKRGCPEDENEMTSTKRRKLELLRNWQELPSKGMKGRGDDDDDDDDDGSTKSTPLSLSDVSISESGALRSPACSSVSKNHLKSPNCAQPSPHKSTVG